MGTYIIKAQMNPAGGGNPDFAPDKHLENGLEADGFLLMIMENGKPAVTAISGMTTLDLARHIASDNTEAGSILHQAIAIAEGLDKAAEIEIKHRKQKEARDLFKILKDM